MKNKKGIIFLIVLAQFCCTSLWFASNAILADLIKNFELAETALPHLTSAVQFGFIIGTFLFAMLSIADRFSPSQVFFVSAIIAASANFSTTLEGNGFLSLLSIRFVTGFFLAGIYPVGMKIASDYRDQGLGKALGFLVGALVLGTAFPHLLSVSFYSLDWKWVLITTSIIATIGGFIIVLFVPDGPFRKRNLTPKLTSIKTIFQNKILRNAAFGYFGHMWELYAFWAFLPIILATYLKLNPEISLNISLLSFIIIAVGSISCVLGGYLSGKYGEKQVARISLLLSCCCCLFSPIIFSVASTAVFIGFLLIWGMAVVADSPLFSTLVAKNAPAESKATALTIVNCFGFAITIVSIQLVSLLSKYVDAQYVFLVLAIGPIIGLMFLFSSKKRASKKVAV